MEWAVDVVDGVNTSDPIVQFNSNGKTGGTSLDVTLSSFASDRNGTVGLFANAQAGPIFGSPEAAYTPLGSTDFHGHTIVTTLGGGWLPEPDTTVSFTWTATVLAQMGIALEVRAGVFDPNSASENVAFSDDPVNTITGDFYHTHTDQFVPTVGQPLDFTRYYHAGSTMQRYLSPGWTHTYDRYLVFNGDDVTVFYPEGHSVIFEDISGVLTPRTGIYDTLEEVAGVYTLTTKSQVEHVFDSGGVLQSISDRNENTLSLSYTSGRLTSVTDDESSPTRSLTIAYKSGTDLIETVTDPLSRVVTFSYDVNDDLEIVTDVKGGDTTYTYGDDGMETLEDANGKLQVTNTYDTAGRVAEQQDAIGETTCIYYGTGPAYTSGNCGGTSPAPASDETIVVDQRGNKMKYIQDAEGRTSEVQNDLGDSITYAFDANNNLTCITDELGRKTAFSSYDAAGNLTQMIDADNTDTTCTRAQNARVWTFEYTELNDPSRVIDPLGRTTTWIYDSSGNLTRLIRPQADAETDTDLDLFHDSFEDPVPFPAIGTEGYLRTDPYSDCAATSVFEDEDPPDGWPWDFNDDQKASLSDVLSFSPHFNLHVYAPELAPTRYDMNYDDLVSLSDVLAIGPVFNTFCTPPAVVTLTFTCFEVNANGLVEAVVTVIDSVLPSDPSDACTGDTTKFDYDSNGNPTAVIDPRFSAAGTPKTTFNIDDGGRTLTVTNELNHTATATYDAHNNVLTVADNLGNINSNTYDAKGNLTSSTDANREAVGAAESGAQCGTAGTGNGVDDDSDSVADDGCPSVIYNYDDADRLIKVIDALGNSTTYSYDENGNLLSVTDANRQPVGAAETGAAQCGPAGTGNGVDDDSDTVADDGCPSTIYAYDSLNRLTSETDALGRDTSYTYDAASQLKERTDARGLLTKYFPDTLGRLDLLEHWDVTLVDSVDYSYDAVGNRTEMVDPTGTTTYVYDTLNRLTSVTFPGASVVSYDYDEVGTLKKITYPDANTVDYTYDEAGNLKTVTDWLTNLTTYMYDDAGNLEKTTLPNGVSTDFGYDTADRLTSILNKKTGPVTISSFTYLLDAAGNRTQMVDTGTNTYDYDDLHRLTSVTYPGPRPVTDTYTYDAVGNRLTMNTDDYTYDAANQLTDLEGLTYGYDDNGNQTTRGSDTFTYDHENRLTQSVLGATTSSSTYNGDGLRMSHTVGMTTTNYTWDVNGSLPVILDDGTNRYVYGLDLIASIDSSDDETYYTYDGLGSTTDLTDDMATVTDTYSYDVFGDASHDSGSSDNYWLFTGEQEDGSEGMYYLRARYLDPATGRFLSQDPIGAAEPYSYVLNNPVRFVDPSGLCHEELGYDRICNLVHHIDDLLNYTDEKEGGLRPPSALQPTPTSTATPTPRPTPRPQPCHINWINLQVPDEFCAPEGFFSDAFSGVDWEAMAECWRAGGQAAIEAFMVDFAKQGKELPWLIDRGSDSAGAPSLYEGCFE